MTSRFSSTSSQHPRDLNFEEDHRAFREPNKSFLPSLKKKKNAPVSGGPQFCRVPFRNLKLRTATQAPLVSVNARMPSASCLARVVHASPASKQASPQLICRHGRGPGLPGAACCAGEGSGHLCAGRKDAGARGVGASPLKGLGCRGGWVGAWSCSLVPRHDLPHLLAGLGWQKEHRAGRSEPSAGPS